jgi:hypothetical protein
VHLGTTTVVRLEGSLAHGDSSKAQLCGPERSSATGKEPWPEVNWLKIRPSGLPVKRRPSIIHIAELGLVPTPCGELR